MVTASTEQLKSFDAFNEIDVFHFAFNIEHEERSVRLLMIQTMRDGRRNPPTLWNPIISRIMLKHSVSTISL